MKAMDDRTFASFLVTKSSLWNPVKKRRDFVFFIFSADGCRKSIVTETSEKSHIDVIPRSARLTEAFGQGATSSEGIPLGESRFSAEI